MTKRILSLFLLLCVFIPAAGCGSGTAPGGSPGASATTAPTPTATVPTTPEPTPTPDPVQARLDAMTTEEKVGQLLMAGFEGTEPGDDDAVFLQDYQVGGLILFGRNIESAEQLTALTNGLKALNGDQIPLLIGVDQEGGLVDRMPPEVHRTPGAYAVGSTSDWDQGRALGAALAAECADFGFHLDFAPVLDVWSNPDNTVIGKRAFGSDWKVVSGFGAAVSNALQAAGVIPVVKHFPGHGDTVVDSHMGLPVVDKSL
ncbi:glycoside hydrolase family 3 N-terminal domain-containing protein, partial [Intestinimonas butyriciproducens]